MDASQCNECGQCDEACPQRITVIDKLKESQKYLMSWVGLFLPVVWKNLIFY